MIDYKTYKKPTDFLRFEQGDTTIRIISKGALGKRHGMKTANGYVPLGLCTESTDCEQCLKGNEPKRTWRWVAIEVGEKEPKVLDAGPMLGNEICNLASEHGDPQEYDIVVNKSGFKLKTKYTAKKSSVDMTITPDEKDAFKSLKAFLVKKYFGV